jgi:acyl-CoA thioesterase-1
MRVLVFGDSIAQGFFDVEGGGWVERLARESMQAAAQDLDGEWQTIFNLGISGDTADGVAKRIAGEMVARRWENEPFAVVVAIGGNDSLIEKGKPWSSPEQYVEQLGAIAQKVRAESAPLLFVGMTAVNEVLTRPVFWGDYHYSNDRIWQFETALRAFAKRENLPVVPLFETFKERLAAEEPLYPDKDGVHPNAAGHELIANLVRPHITKLIQP